MVKLGTIAAIGFDESDPHELLGCYRQLGCQVVQAYRNQGRHVSLSEMRDAIAAGGMPCDSLHGIFGEHIDPSSPDEQTRRFAVDIYKREAELADTLGGKLVVVHCSTIREAGVSSEEHARRTEQLKKSIAELGAFGLGAGVTFAFENMPGYHAIGSDVGALAGILTDTAAPNTGMCFDCGHANMVGDPVAAVAKTDGTMIYAHISDNSGNGDDHEMITCGTIDADALAEAMHRIGYDGTFMLEVFHSADRIRKLIDEGLTQRLERIINLANGKE
ncbi:MAG: sugar phosphate isomerase/epimerase family protein [Planctomycetota bacterium]|nr:sugar phosphate isomerase/epimerase family protein [Planctomycetota bacterium]